MKPSQRYEQDVLMGNLLPDPQQALAVIPFDRLYDDLLACRQSPATLFHRIVSILRRCHTRPIKGIYLWGGVGAGKTYLMDLFYSCLPAQGKRRVHFHGFMREVHRELKVLQGVQEPLDHIAKLLAQEVQILCFDEFFISDIGDAMILGRLLIALQKAGIALALTSNLPPEGLYPNGLQRQQFLPAIQALLDQTEVFHLSAAQDYRLRNLTAGGVYFYPLDDLTALKMRNIFGKISAFLEVHHSALLINGREIPTLRWAKNVLWMDFNVLCAVPRSQQDYLEISEQFGTVLLSHVPAMGAEEDNQITYFINLVDIFYDAGVKLIIAAAMPIEELYLEGRKLFEFQRTQSRLIEMQSEEYLSRAHKRP